MTVIATIEQLEAIYGEPGEASTVKVADRVTPSYRVLIDKSPFAALATCGPEGLDCSPRGDLSGFVRVHDEKTLMMPDRRGNNRVDSLRNIVRDPRVALLFLIPGAGSTLRVNGRAQVSDDAELLASARSRKLDLDDYLRRNDAYNFFVPLGGLIKTGPTHTNVCDVRVVVVKRDA